MFESFQILKGQLIDKQLMFNSFCEKTCPNIFRFMLISFWLIAYHSPNTGGLCTDMSSHLFVVFAEYDCFLN